MGDDERAAWLCLGKIEGLSARLYKRLLEKIGPPGNILSASAEMIASVDGVAPELAAAIRRARPGPEEREELARADRTQASFVSFFHPAYPLSLKQIEDPPPFFYLFGELWERDIRSIAVVGSRQASPYGIEAAKFFSGGLAREGLTVVSGFAAGVDRAAHLAALESGGRTIAVLGCGLDMDYPSGSAELKERIGSQGAVISEFPMGTRPYPSNFPRRNRIISGLSLGVLVVEAALRSGSLVTASAALEQGREVFAVPGSFHNPLSRGTHRLIQTGAKLVTDIPEILEEVTVHLARSGPAGLEAAGSLRESEAVSLNPDEKKICDILTVDPVYFDDLSRKAGMAASRCSEVLLNLELKGLIHRMEGNRFMSLQTGQKELWPNH